MTTSGNTTSCSANRTNAAGSARSTDVSTTYVRRPDSTCVGRADRERLRRGAPALPAPVSSLSVSRTGGFRPAVLAADLGFANAGSVDCAGGVDAFAPVERRVGTWLLRQARTSRPAGDLH